VYYKCVFSEELSRCFEWIVCYFHFLCAASHKTKFPQMTIEETNEISGSFEFFWFLFFVSSLRFWMFHCLYNYLGTLNILSGEVQSNLNTLGLTIFLCWKLNLEIWWWIMFWESLTEWNEVQLILYSSMCNIMIKGILSNKVNIVFVFTLYLLMHIISTANRLTTIFHNPSHFKSSTIKLNSCR
jgi:hypothetical protein